MTDADSGELSTHRFEAHEALLLNVMRDQAGTLEKGILEGVMNSIDAGATRIDIRVTWNSVEIRDNGKGFVSKDEILRCFKVFGLPQDLQEKLSKTYGHFRMGRGQIFHYGPNVWRTNTFSMRTDLDNRGLDFDVLSGIEPSQPGCLIEIQLYERHHMLPSELAELETAVARAVKYAPAKILLNGKLISRDPADEKWDLETEDAWIRIRESGTLDIYNQGVYVESKSAVDFGTAGIVVSKGKLKVNFARNMVMAGECPIWKRIRAKLREATDTRIRNRKEKLTPAMRDMLARRIVAGDPVDRPAELALVTDVSGVDWSIKRVASHCKRYHIVQVLVAPGADRRGAILHQERRAFVIHPTTLERFRCEAVDEFLAVLRRPNLWPQYQPIPRVGTFSDPSLEVNTDLRLVPAELVRPLERVILDYIQKLHRWELLREGWGQKNVRERQFVLGESANVQAWTDGSTYIAIERRVLQRLESLEGWISLSLLLASQYCSEIDTGGVYEHGPGFYLRFFEMATRRCPEFAAHGVGGFPEQLRKLQRQTRKRLLRTADRTAALQREWGAARKAAEAEEEALRELDLAADAARGGLPAQIPLADIVDPDKKPN